MAKGSVRRVEAKRFEDAERLRALERGKSVRYGLPRGVELPSGGRAVRPDVVPEWGKPRFLQEDMAARRDYTIRTGPAYGQLTAPGTTVRGQPTVPVELSYAGDAQTRYVEPEWNPGGNIHLTYLDGVPRSVVDAYRTDLPSAVPGTTADAGPLLPYSERLLLPYTGPLPPRAAGLEPWMMHNPDLVAMRMLTEAPATTRTAPAKEVVKRDHPNAKALRLDTDTDDSVLAKVTEMKMTDRYKDRVKRAEEMADAEYLYDHNVIDVDRSSKEWKKLFDSYVNPNPLMQSHPLRKFTRAIPIAELSNPAKTFLTRKDFELLTSPRAPSSVRIAVLTRTDTPMDLLAKAVREGSDLEAAAVMSRDTLPEHLVHAGLERKSVLVDRAICGRKDLTQATMVRLWSDPYTRTELAKSRSATPEFLSLMVRDGNPYVVAAAARNPRLAANDADYLLRSSDNTFAWWGVCSRKDVSPDALKIAFDKLGESLHDPADDAMAGLTAGPIVKSAMSRSREKDPAKKAAMMMRGRMLSNPAFPQSEVDSMLKEPTRFHDLGEVRTALRRKGTVDKFSALQDVWEGYGDMGDVALSALLHGNTKTSDSNRSHANILANSLAPEVSRRYGSLLHESNEFTQAVKGFADETAQTLVRELVETLRKDTSGGAAHYLDRIDEGFLTGARNALDNDARTRFGDPRDNWREPIGAGAGDSTDGVRNAERGVVRKVLDATDTRFGRFESVRVFDRNDPYTSDSLDVPTGITSEEMFLVRLIAQRPDIVKQRVGAQSGGLPFSTHVLDTVSDAVHRAAEDNRSELAPRVPAGLDTSDFAALFTAPYLSNRIPEAGQADITARINSMLAAAVDKLVNRNGRTARDWRHSELSAYMDPVFQYIAKHPEIRNPETVMNVLAEYQHMTQGLSEKLYGQVGSEINHTLGYELTKGRYAMSIAGSVLSADPRVAAYRDTGLSVPSVPKYMDPRELGDRSFSLMDEAHTATYSSFGHGSTNARLFPKQGWRQMLSPETEAYIFDGWIDVVDPSDRRARNRLLDVHARRMHAIEAGFGDPELLLARHKLGTLVDQYRRLTLLDTLLRLGQSPETAVRRMNLDRQADAGVSDSAKFISHNELKPRNPFDPGTLILRREFDHIPAYNSDRVEEAVQKNFPDVQVIKTRNEREFKEASLETVRKLRQDAKGGESEEEVSTRHRNAARSVVPFIKRHEGFRPRAYKGVDNKWTIGYGQTELDGRPVREGDEITEYNASRFVDARVRDVAAAIYRDMPWTRNASQGALSALYDLAYNGGLGMISEKTSPTLNRMGNAAKTREEVDEAIWSQVPTYVRSGGRRLRGLINRRSDAIAEFRR